MKKWYAASALIFDKAIETHQASMLYPELDTEQTGPGYLM